MKSQTRTAASSEWIAIILFIAFIAISAIASATPPPENPDKTLSPYFQVLGTDGTVDAMPLKSTSADVNIAGVIADVAVTQVYENKGEKTLEAIYVFPGSTSAAVYDMTMTIGDRVLQATIKDKTAARQEYDAAKAAGKSASLLEQKRPNVFEMNVANIQPGDVIQVELKYTEMLVPTDGIYEFVYPTVVGPRYNSSATTNATASVDNSFVESPYTKEGVAPTYTFDIATNINTGIPIKALRCPSHKVTSNYLSMASAEVNLDPLASYSGNRDFVLQYQLQGKEVESGMLLYEGEKENFFLMTVQPPKDVVQAQIPAREYIFILDVSGSMNGFPLDITKSLMEDLFNRLSPNDYFNVMHFAGSNSVLSPTSLKATPANIKRAVSDLKQAYGGGGTELLPALHRALDLPRTPGMSRSVVIATDGYVTVEKEAFDLIRTRLGDANFFAFGIGSSVNRYIIEGMAKVGMGEPFVVLNQGEASEQANKLMRYIESPVLTDIDVEYGDFEVYDTEPFAVPDVLAERPITIFGKYRGTPKGKIKISGVTGGGEYCQEFNLEDYSAEASNSGLRYLWARERIKMLDDYNKVAPDSKNQEEVKQLGLDYNLLTAYTSFIAVDSEVRGDSVSVTVNQPLPLPKGVSNQAVGAASTRYKTKAYGYTYAAPDLKSENLYRAYEVERAYEVSEETTIDAVEIEVEDASEVSWNAEPLESPADDFDFEGDNLEEDEVFLIAEEMPEYPGGEAEMMRFLTENIQYPQTAKEAGIEGKVFLRFTVEKDGSISDIKVLRSPSKELEQEAIRVLKLMTNWKPGKQAGKPVSVKCTLPITFKLND